MRRIAASVAAAFVLGFCASGHAQQSHWATPNDPVAKYMIEMERQWAEEGCTKKNVAEKFLADDFHGTAPDGSLYDRAEALKHDASLVERECRLDEARVRFFGDTVAIVYGRERAMRTPPGGKEALRCLAWTDTWLKRDGKWQIIAVQDAVTACK